MRLFLLNMLVSLATVTAGRLKLRMIEVEKELEIQKKINQQQTLILLHLAKETTVDLSALKTAKTIQRRSQTELKINENILELITPNPEEPAPVVNRIQPVEKPTSELLTIPKSSKFTFFGFRKRTKNEIAMDRIKNIEKFVLDKSAEIMEDFEELGDRFKETSDSVKDLIANQFWSSWSEWTPCSTTCERGIMRRHRHCNAETSCIGSREQRKKCGGRNHLCRITWNEWSSYSTCSKTCGAGVKSRKRTCRHGDIGHENCARIDSEESVLCNTQDCSLLIIFGGREHENKSLLIDPISGELFKYHHHLPEENQPMSFIGSCAVIFQNNLIAAGHDHIGKMNQVFMLKQTLWIPLPFLEHQRNSAACAVFQERMIVCGGGNANAGQTCEMMPPHLKHWERFPPMMTYRSRGPGMAATTWGLLVAGANYPNSRTEILVDRRLGWKEGPELAFKIGTTTMVANEDEAFIVGGYQGVEKFVLRLKSADSDWEEMGTLNRVRYKHASVLVGREIWLFGGHEKGTNVVEVFDISTRRSTDLAIFIDSNEGMLRSSAARIT